MNAQGLWNGYKRFYDPLRLGEKFNSGSSSLVEKSLLFKKPKTLCRLKSPIVHKIIVPWRPLSFHGCVTKREEDKVKIKIPRKKMNQLQHSAQNVQRDMKQLQHSTQNAQGDINVAAEFKEWAKMEKMREK